MGPFTGRPDGVYMHVHDHLSHRAHQPIPAFRAFANVIFLCLFISSHYPHVRGAGTVLFSAARPLVLPLVFH